VLQYEKEYDTIPPRRRNVDNLEATVTHKEAIVKKIKIEIPLLSVRPPIKPVTFDSLIAENH